LGKRVPLGVGAFTGGCSKLPGVLWEAKRGFSPNLEKKGRSLGEGIQLRVFGHKKAGLGQEGLTELKGR